jgi:hypothetical protein
VGAGAEQAENEHGYGKEEQATYLATAFGLPASCCRSGQLWHGIRDSGRLLVLEVFVE